MRSYGRRRSSALPWIRCRQLSAPRASAPAEASSSFSLPARPGYYSDSIEQSFSKENVVRDCSPAIGVSLVILPKNSAQAVRFRLVPPGQQRRSQGAAYSRELWLSAGIVKLRLTKCEIAQDRVCQR